jgi:predicted component of type VI protein secretion system
MGVLLEPVNGKGVKIAIDKAILFIGRHPECDVVITRSRMISRKHCAIVQVNDALVLRDLGSTNGVRINGRRVHKEGRFSVGDTVTIGDLEYTVKHVKTPAPERRAERDHPQDAREAGATPVRLERAVPSLDPFSQEIPVAIPEDEDFDDEPASQDTPDSMPIVSPRKRPDDRSERSSDSSRHSEEDSHIPLSD